MTVDGAATGLPPGPSPVPSPVSSPEPSGGLEDLGAACARISQSIQQVIEGKPEVVRLALAVLLAEGHLLIEDVPGVGKTMLAKALARSHRLLGPAHPVHPRPAAQRRHRVSASTTRRPATFEFKPGAIFANIVLGDEINRASPKTQSALLEAMEERQVTVDGTTYALAAPFMVIATQNPDRDGGHLPAARGAARPLHGADRRWATPTPTTELAMLDTHGAATPLDDPAARDRRATDVTRLVALVRTVHVRRRGRAATRRRWPTPPAPPRRCASAPRPAPPCTWCAPPARAAALDGRDYVIPDDVQTLAVPVLAHRVLLTAEAQVGRSTPEQIIADLVARIPVPDGVR